MTALSRLLTRDQIEFVVARARGAPFPVPAVPGDGVPARLKGMWPSDRHELVLRLQTQPGAEGTGRSGFIASLLVYRHPDIGALVEGERDAHTAAAIPRHVLYIYAQGVENPGKLRLCKLSGPFRSGRISRSSFLSPRRFRSQHGQSHYDCAKARCSHDFLLMDLGLTDGVCPYNPPSTSRVEVYWRWLGSGRKRSTGPDRRTC